MAKLLNLLSHHPLPYLLSLSLARSSTTHTSSSPSSPSVLSSKVHGRLLFDLYIEQCQSNIYITLQYIPPNYVTEVSSTSWVVSGLFPVGLSAAGLHSSVRRMLGSNAPSTSLRQWSTNQKQMSDDTVVGDDGSAYLFWLPEQISFACLDIWAGSKLR